MKTFCTFFRILSHNVLSLFNCQILCFIDTAFESSIGGALIKIGLGPPRTWYFGSFISHYAFTSLCGGGQFSEEPPWAILPTGSHLHKEEKKGCWSAGRDFSPVFLYHKIWQKQDLLVHHPIPFKFYMYVELIHCLISDMTFTQMERFVFLNSN